jgi:hypothetical protein
VKQNIYKQKYKNPTAMKKSAGKNNLYNMKMKRLLLISLIAICIICQPQALLGQRSWTFNYSLGEAYNLNMPLVIEQQGFEKLKFTAHYNTHAFKMPLYYSLKLGTSRERKGWELELTHNKIFLTNNPPEVQFFRITHGYNYLTINRIWDKDFLILRIGAGMIIAHPENSVRNMSYDTSLGFLNRGYHLSGAGLQLAAEKRFHLFKGLFFSLEVKAAAAIARVGVAEGHAVVPQAGVHGLFGLGYTFK